MIEREILSINVSFLCSKISFGEGGASAPLTSLGLAIVDLLSLDFIISQLVVYDF